MNDEKRSAGVVVWITLATIVVAMIAVTACGASARYEAEEAREKSASLAEQIETLEEDKTYLAAKVGTLIDRMNEVGLPITPMTREEELAAGACATEEEMIEHGTLEFVGNKLLSFYSHEAIKNSKGAGYYHGTGLLEYGVSIALNQDFMREVNVQYGDEIYLQSDGFTGWYVLEDTGCAYDRVDLYVESNSDIPSHGVEACSVWIKR